MDDAILGYWEPGAPGFAERLNCLKHAYRKGFPTSVHIAPMLDVPNVVQLFRKVAPFVTESIWLGKMNHVRRRVQPKTREELEAVRQIEENQADDKVLAVYKLLKDEPLVRWLNSIRVVVDGAAAVEAGVRS
jgi:DNA repair photolyase